VLLMVCLWVTSAAFAEHVSAEFSLCQPDRSPCCPQPVNNAGNSGESCPACRIVVSVAEKDSKEQDQEQPRLASRTGDQRLRRPSRPAIASHRELTDGLRYRRVVFDLKDDLRI
jgi:hypothetical protein